MTDLSRPPRHQGRQRLRRHPARGTRGAAPTASGWTTAGTSAATSCASTARRRALSTPTTTPATRASTATPAARGSSAACTPTARWSSGSSRRARSSSTTDADFVTMFGLRGFVPAQRARGTRDRGAAATTAPGELRVEYRFSPAPQPPQRRRRLRQCRAVECDDERFGAVLRARLRRPRDAAVVARRRAVLRGRDPVVRNAVRPRQPHHGDADARLRARRRRGDAAPAGGADRPRGRPRARGGAGQDPARAAARGDAARRSRATTAASTRRRCFCSRSRRRATRRCRPSLRPAAEAARAWIARRDPLTYTAGRPAPPGLEGLRGRRAGRSIPSR